MAMRTMNGRLGIVGGLSALTRGFSYLGLPALATPMGYDGRGLPIGLQFVCSPFQETLLFQVAQGYERISPARGRRPGVVSSTQGVRSGLPSPQTLSTRCRLSSSAISHQAYGTRQLLLS